MLRATVSLSPLAILVIALAACGGDGGSSSPTAPADRTLVLSEASILVDGQVVPPDGTFRHNHGRASAPAATRFEARLLEDGAPAVGRRVQVSFERPGGMMHRSGSFFLYDDGTHGDHVAGDGLYCLEDPDGAYGFHHMGAAHGEYHYDFCGLYPDGAETNHHLFHVTVDE